MARVWSQGWRALWRCHLAALHMFAEAGVYFAVVFSVVLLPSGLGFVTLPRSATALRALADRSRDWADRWSGVQISPPEPLTAQDGSRYQRSIAILGDGGFWRDLIWSMLNPLVGCLLVAIPPFLVWYGAIGVVAQPLVFLALGQEVWYGPVPVHDIPTGLAAIVLSAGFIGLGLWLAPQVLLWHARWNRSLLAASRSTELSRRVVRLTDTRADALDSQIAELRRIERDLHDGAQARLVALGLTLDRAARLLDADPRTARTLLEEGRDTSTRALNDLRELVHGILPPVLADRGLGDAVRSLALDSVLDVTVEVGLAGRLPAPVESAAYFAVSELLTNAAKHSGGTAVRVVLAHDGDTLRITVTDDGRGGADPDLGSGLRGLRRRLGTFDGVLALHSPPGGPTTVTLEIPCAPSSPKTSSS